ncbi:type I restriction enzyme, S subunit [Pseudomonas sp. NFACC49-2]|uniref:restriction endonuclease subunit S n=1 Tax=Pseudomonas sp. NFACC49-2 TaxID=1566222 RepID=UPI000912090B|nr:restriction endonuclease subunit S [Pseudomonas sp. NFACC49-2]SFX55777.1 type I restriction enzyme, S subunit [Pseudomonas sp. NFACC49-2]
MSRFKPYPAYKDSGVEWLGEVPESWTAGTLRWYSTIQGGIAKGKDYEGRDTISLPYLRVANVQDGFVDLTEIKQISVLESELERYSLRAGDVLMNEGGDNDKLGRGAVWQGQIEPCLHQNHVFAIRPNDLLKSEWLAAFTGSQPARTYFFLSSKQSTNLASISASNIMSLVVPIPPVAEQTQVLRFLDHETARIDVLIGEQQRLIELLKEKRQAVISHAVTKGLDPTVPMKDSGVKWLGEVPAHWEVTQIKRRCKLITDGAHISPETENGIYCFVSTKDVSDEGIDFEGCLRTSTTSYQYLVKTGCQPAAGDVLFSKDGTIGRTIVVSEDAPEFVIASSLIIIRPDNEQLLPGYLHALCQSWVITQQVDGFVKGAGLPRLSIQNLLKVIGIFPPAKEQAYITEFLQQESKVTRQLTKEAWRTMELLKERRSALISAAVTGKIDVRGWQPPASVSSPVLDEEAV